MERSWAGLPVAVLGSAMPLHLSSLPGRGRWQQGMGTGAVSCNAITTSPDAALFCAPFHLQMLGHHSDNGKETANTVSGCLSSPLHPQGIDTSIGAKAWSRTTPASYLVSLVVLLVKVRCNTLQYTTMQMVTWVHVDNKLNRASSVLSWRCERGPRMWFTEEQYKLFWCYICKFLSPFKSRQHTHMLQHGALEENTLGSSHFPALDREQNLRLSFETIHRYDHLLGIISRMKRVTIFFSLNR